MEIGILCVFICRWKPEIILHRGYPVEIHEITTADGYILQVHRIPYGRTSFSRQSQAKRAVFLQHGLLNSDADWLINPTDKSLGKSHSPTSVGSSYSLS